jgi:hypothetical protein
MKSKILKFELLGMVFISLFGSFLHFTFNLSHKFWLIGAFSAVNESTWEHLKLAVMAAGLWILLENKIFKLRTNNFFFAKMAGIYLMPVLIAVFFYGYKAILGHHTLLLDILIFFIAVIVGQLISLKIMTAGEFSKNFEKVSLLLIFGLLFIFVIFTFYPPHLFLFQDPISGLYGIIK